MRRVFVLSPCDVFPPVHGSSTAIYHTLQYLSETNRVSALLCHLYSQRGEVDLRVPNLRVQYCRESGLDRLGYKGLGSFPNGRSNSRILSVASLALRTPETEQVRAIAMVRI